MFSYDSKATENQSDLPANQTTYYSLAVEATNAVKQRFSLGAVNRVDVVKKHKLSDRELIQYLAQLENFGKSNRVDRSADISQTTLFGMCGIFTSYAIGYLCHKYANDPDKSLIEIVHLDQHVMLLLGRKPGSDPNKIESWGKKAILCDIWADKIYYASQFRMMQHNVACGREENILCYESVVIDNILTLQVRQAFYLAGEPRVNENPALVRSSIDWVIEDMRRQALPEPQLPVTLPASSITTAPRLSSEEKEALTKRFARITKFENWQVNNANGLVVWRKGFTKEEADRVAETLKFARVARVIRGTTKVNNDSVPMIKCEAIDYQKITQLASALKPRELNTPDFDFETLMQNLFSK